MAQLQCPKCQMYKVKEHPDLFISDQTGDVKTVDPPLLMIVLMFVAFVCGPFGLIGVPLAFMMKEYGNVFASAVMLGAAIFAFRQLRQRGTQSKKPAGHTRYHSYECEIDGYRWRVKAANQS